MVSLEYIDIIKVSLSKIKQAIEHIQGAMSQTVYGKNLSLYRSQLNEYIFEQGEIQAEFDMMCSKKTYSIMAQLKLKSRNLLDMIRNNQMYKTLKDLVFDIYCKNPKTFDSKNATAPNLTFLYESGLKSAPSSIL